MYINRTVFYLAHMKLTHLVAHDLKSACSIDIWRPEKSEQGDAG